MGFRNVAISSVAASASGPTVYAFVTLVVLQSAHMVEHVAQVYQHGLLGLPIAASRGLVFFLDLEWNHMIFNALYWGLLAIVFVGCGFYRPHGPVGDRPRACLAFSAAFVFQGYHVVEHAVRMGQFFERGCTPCPGILGTVFDGVYLHATFNSIVYILPVIAFVAYGFHRRVLHLRPRVVSQ